MNIIGIIPSRYGSTRLEAKALLDIGGKTLVQRVYEQAVQSRMLTRVIVATDHPAIASHVRDFGGEAMMTDEHHRNGTERCREVIERLACDCQYVVNIQGDEPFIHPDMIDQTAALLDGTTEIATLVNKINDPADLLNPSEAKVIVNDRMEAMYFSRAPIPYLMGVPQHEWLRQHEYYKHVSIYAYRADVLSKVTGLMPTPLEIAERLEQLRWIEHGFKIKIGITPHENFGIDTPADLERARNLVASR